MVTFVGVADDDRIDRDSVLEYLQADFAGNGEKIMRHGGGVFSNIVS